MKYSGIDLHSNNSVVVVTDEQDRMLEERHVPNDLSVNALTFDTGRLMGVVFCGI
jgi:hypothetical protein